MRKAIEREGRAILGGDIAFSLIQRQASPAERAFMTERGAVSEIAAFSAMARRSDGSDQTLVELKAVDGAYPLVGTMGLEHPDADLHDLLAGTDGQPAAVVDRDLLIRLGLEVGDLVKVGDAEFRIAGIVGNEPDRLSGNIELGPRVMIDQAGLAATGLVQPGSLIQWVYRLRLDEPVTDEAIKTVEEEAKAAFPEAGWRIRGRDDAAPGLRQNIDRFAQFLTLVGLTALLVGGVGVANAVGAFLDRKRDVIATLKCLGASGGFVLRVYLLQILVLAGIGILLGLVLGAAMPFIAAAFLADVIPIPLEPAVYPGSLALAAIYGLATALAFALWPLGRSRHIPPAALFRDRVAPQRRRPRLPETLGALAAVLVLAGLAIGLADQRWLAIIFVVGALGSFLLLRLVAVAVMALARQAPRVSSAELRLALGNIHRRGALTPTVVLSLGLGLTLLVTISLVDSNLRRQLSATIPERAPSFFFVDIQQADMAAFGDLLSREVPEATVDRVPTLRGRIVAVDGTPADKVTPSSEVRWVLSGDRGITYAATKPDNATVTKGAWWPADYDGPPLVSFEAEVAAGLGLDIGDSITVNVSGRDITATIANLRRVEWQSLGINYVMVFSPSSFVGAPHTYMATLTYPAPVPAEAEIGLMRDVTNAFPSITTIRVKEALDRVNDLVGQIAWGVRAAAAIALITAMLVLGGALAASHRQRIYDAVILKTLGATRRRLIVAYGLEYLMLGVATAIFALAAGGVAAWFVTASVMESAFRYSLPVALAALGLAVALTVGFGLAGTWRALGQKAAPILRNM